MKTILFLITVLLTTVKISTAREWVISIPIKGVKIVSTKGLKSPKWFISKFNVVNMTNLSFFNHTYIGPYKDSLNYDLRNPKKWPFISIDTFCTEGGNDSLGIIFYNDLSIPNKNSRFIVSGTPLILKDGVEQPIKRNGFTLAKRPRTVIGNNNNDSILIYVSSAIRIVDMPKRLKNLGFKNAMNLDGGGSTLLYRDSVYVYRQKKLRSYPNILTW